MVGGSGHGSGWSSRSEPIVAVLIFLKLEKKRMMQGQVVFFGTVMPPESLDFVNQVFQTYQYLSDLSISLFSSKDRVTLGV